MIRFTLKAAIAGTAVYYLKQEGIWKESDISLKTYAKLNSALEPYVKEVCKQIPVELPEIPSSERTTHTVQRYWNKGVIWTFAFLRDLPENVGTWTSEGVSAVLDNPEFKRMFEGPTDGAGEK